MLTLVLILIDAVIDEVVRQIRIKPTFFSFFFMCVCLYVSACQLWLYFVFLVCFAKLI